ncbi:acyl-CoA N-acyltransferase [Microthyrium microscopicum]|uniref:Glucosamine 6-phosphate N-acetyltransferase n=1 Tax=Microthyrium microscopicum TaxID=703497 RepID=A0A6A6U2H7_9PEZI|nr:acyl-CoA N-acyltransferase [Microthyrium microscopicum]
MASADALFSPNLVPAAVQESLPDGLIMRPLQRDDYKRGHLEVLKDLAHVGDITESEWIDRFDWMVNANGSYFILVIVDDSQERGRIVGTGTLIVEKKFLFKLGTQGHVEDVGIIKALQGKRLGTKMIEALDHIASQLGCYKTILDCSGTKEHFYVKCGYEKAGTEMHHYYDSEAQKYRV